MVSRRSLGWRAVPPLILLVALPALAEEPVKAAASDVLDLCTAPLPTDAGRKAEKLGWQPAPANTIDTLRPLLEPLGGGTKIVQGWEGGDALGSEMIACAYDAPASDGSVTAMLKSFLPRGHACLYLASADAAALTDAITRQLGTAPTNDPATAAIATVSIWQTSSVIATLRDISRIQPPYKVALTVITK